MKERMKMWINSRWEKRKQYLELKRKIKQEKQSYKNKMSTTKKIVLFLFLNCACIEIYTGIVLWKSLQLMAEYGGAMDFTPLVALISTVVGEVIAFAIYSVKSLKENSAGGIVYDMAMLNTECEEETEEGEE